MMAPDLNMNHFVELHALGGLSWIMDLEPTNRIGLGRTLEEGLRGDLCLFESVPLK